MNLAWLQELVQEKEELVHYCSPFSPFTVLHCIPDITPSLAQGSDKEHGAELPANSQ